MATLRVQSPALAIENLVDNFTGVISGSSINNSITYSGDNNMAHGDNNDGSLFFIVPPVNASNNQSGNGSVDFDLTPPIYIMIWITVTNVLVFSVGVFGNLLVIVVVLFVREMKTSTNLCLMNLSVADLLVLLICCPASMLEYYLNDKWLLGQAMCKMVVFLENFVTLLSILIIITVSLERFWAVYYPLRTYSSGSKSKAMLSMLLVWIIAGVANSPFFVMANTVRRYHTLDNEMVDACESPIDQKWKTGYVISKFVFVFAIPLFLLIFLYTMIILKVINKPMECKQMTETARAQAQQNRKQLVIMLVGIIILFFLCLLPFHIFTMWLLLSPESAYTSTSMETFLNVTHFCRLLIYINSAGNPIIYNLASTKFRRAFQRVLRMYCPCLAKRGSGIHANGTYSHATRMTTMSHYSVVKQSPNGYSESVDTV